MSNKENADELKDVKDLEMRLFDSIENELIALRKLVDSDIEIAEKINYERYKRLYDLRADIDDGLSMIFSLKNMLKSRNTVESFGRLSKISDGLHDFIESIYHDLDEF